MPVLPIEFRYEPGLSFAPFPAFPGAGQDAIAFRAWARTLGP